jgi:hypothetical protein
MVLLGKKISSEAADKMIAKLIQDGLYKGFTLLDIRDVSHLSQYRASIRKFYHKWCGYKVESIGWRWLGVHGERPTLLVAYTGRMSESAAFQLCRYVFGGK